MKNHKLEFNKISKQLLVGLFFLLILFFSLFILENNSSNEIYDVAKMDVGTSPSLEITGADLVRLLFVGDIMLDRSVARAARKNGGGDMSVGADSLFAEILPLFLGKDLIIGNLEGTITSNSSVSEKNNKVLRFTFDPVFAGALARAGFSALNLANNHTFDFDVDGFNQTKNNLERLGLGFFGSPLNAGESDLSWSKTVRGKKFCFVGYHDLFTKNPEPVLKEIELLRKVDLQSSACDFISLVAHWGEEYAEKQSERQTMLARTFIDAGVDLIIGAHSHVVQPVEIYKNRAIFYSLGNFIFDQDFSFATKHGLTVGVELVFEGERLAESRFEMIPVVIDTGVVSIDQTGDVQVFELKN